MAVSKKRGEILKTMALGSCIGVVIYDPALKTAGLLHFALPDSSARLKNVGIIPSRYADTGIPLIIKEMMKMGSKGGRYLTVKIVGGAQIMDPNDTFNIGKRNMLAAKKILWKHRVFLKSEEVGGSISRTVSVEVDSGKVIISSPGRSMLVL